MAEYIDKETAVLFLWESAEGLHGTPSWASLLEECADKIADFPAADVRENVRAEWIQHYETTSDNETLPYGWECSLCGRWEMEKQPFCNCGAKMEEHDG